MGITIDTQINYQSEESTGKEAYRTWQDRIAATLKWRQKNFDEQWKRYARLYRGDHWGVYIGSGLERTPTADYPRTYITQNEVGSIVNMMLPFLMKNNPFIAIRPTHVDEIISAKLQQDIINYSWERYDIQQQLEKIVLDAIVIGHGIGKTGYNLKVDTAAKPRDDGQIYYEDYIKVDCPFAKRVSPFLFIFDPEASEHNLATARWCGELIPKAPMDVLANEDFDKAVLRKVRRNMGKPRSMFFPQTFDSIFREAEGKSKYDNLKEEDRNRWCLVEIWDKKFHKRYVFLMGVEDPLIEEPWPHEHLDQFPYVMLPFIPTINESYPIGAVQWVEDMQYELDRHVTQLFEFRRTATQGAMQFIDQLEPEEEKKYRSGLKEIKVPMMDAIQPIRPPELAPDIWRIESEIRQNMRNTLGVDELIRGGDLPDRTSATEVNTRSSIAGLKIKARQKEIDRFVKAWAHQILNHIKAYWQGSQVAQLSGAIGQYWGNGANQAPAVDGNYYATYTKEDIQAEADIEIVSTSKPDYDPITDRQQMLSLFQITAQIYPILQQEAMMGGGLITNMYKSLLEKFDERDAALWFPLAAVAPAPVQSTTQQQPQMGQAQPQQTPLEPTAQAQQGAATGTSQVLGNLNFYGGPPKI